MTVAADPGPQPPADAPANGPASSSRLPLSVGQGPHAPAQDGQPRPRSGAGPRFGSRRARIALAAGLALAMAVGGAAMAVRSAIADMKPLPLAAAEAQSVTVVDREDKLLRAFTTSDGRWRLPVEIKDVDPRYFAILMAFEDKRFYEHGGVDPYALMRAAWQMATSGRIVSGGSTITMQVARLIEGRHERNAGGKVRQMARALELEGTLSKDEILRLYLRLAPFGGNLEGVRAATLSYFGKEPKHLSVGEAALLVALPQSPEMRRPDRNAKAARRARDAVLDRALAASVIKPAEVERAKAEAVPSARLEFPKLAPHLSEKELASRPQEAVHRLTLDRDAQRALETLASEQAKLLGPRLSAAMLAIDNATGHVLAYVGSADYLDRERFGGIDMVDAVRSPGSTLKPMIYGLAFEAGLAHPETLIEDRPTRFGSYRPENFDEAFYGTVTIREALGNSLNVPAVKVLAAVGPGKLAGRLRRAGIETLLPAAATPSLAIALGGVGMRLSALAELYTGLARGGEPVDLTWRRAAVVEAGQARKPVASTSALPRRLLSKVAAWYVTDILKDAPPPANATRGQIAYKTGTSYGYRDAWAAGYDGRHTIVVWIGRPDGASTPGLMGRLAAAPILFDAFARLDARRAPLPRAPTGAIVAQGASLPPPLKRFREAGDEDVAQGPYLDPPVLISFPPDRAELELTEREEEPLVLKAEGGALPLTWLIDGTPLATDPHSREIAWPANERGFVKLQVVDAKGRVDRVTVRLK